QVSMDHSFFVRRLQCFYNLRCNRQCVVQRQRTASNPLRQRLAGCKLHDEEFPSAGFFEPMNCGNVRMIQRSQHACFTLESSKTLGVTRECFGQDLDRHTSTEFGVAGLIDLAHSAGAEVSCYLVMCEFGADHVRMLTKSDTFWDGG